MQADFAVVAHGKGHFIAVIKKLKHGFQLVVTVFATTEDVQHQVQFCRGGQHQRIFLHVIVPTDGVANLLRQGLRPDPGHAV